MPAPRHQHPIITWEWSTWTYMQRKSLGCVACDTRLILKRRFSLIQLIGLLCASRDVNEMKTSPFWCFCISICLAFEIYAQRQPGNITRAAGESNVFIPCPFDVQSTPPIWKINGIDYTAVTLPSKLFSLTPGGLFINEVHECLNQTSYQCIDTSDDILQGKMSNIGFLTVISSEICIDSELEEFLNFGADLELDHRNIQYGNATTTLVWKIFPSDSDCNISHILSYHQCEQNSPDINETIDDTSITIPSVNVSIGGQLADFAISSLSDQESVECPRLQETVRFNVTQTEQINLLLGNNNCTSVPMKRRGSLNFAMSNPNPDKVDVICPIYAPANLIQCYSPHTCNNFDGNIIPFFRICEDSSVNSYNLLFGNVTRQLNGTRLDFFIRTKALCQTSPVYIARTYVRSFELNVTNASSDTNINITSREVCFSSESIDCDLTIFTLYNFSVVDISNNTIFKMDKIPESTCIIVDQLGLLPQCGPFMATTRPFNDYIMYDLDANSQQITLDNNEISTANLCSCLKKNTQLQLSTKYSSPDFLLKVDYQCSTLYGPQFQITISDRPSLQFTHVITCSEGRTEFNIDSDLCGTDINFCGYFTFENRSAFTDCALSCSTVSVVCPTTPTPTTTPSTAPDRDTTTIVIGSIVGIIIASVIILIVIVYFWYRSSICGNRAWNPEKF